MSLKSDLYAALQGFVGGRCWPDRFDQPATGTPVWPAIRYSVISGEIAADICGHGTEQTDDVRIQVDVVAAVEAQRNSIKTAVRDRMATFALPALLEGTPAETFDTETQTYRASMDFVIYGSS